MWHSVAIWHHRTGSTLVQVMSCCLMATSHYLIQYWLVISEVLWHSPGSIFTFIGHAVILYSNYENDTFHIIVISPSCQWVNGVFCIMYVSWVHITVAADVLGPCLNIKTIFPKYGDSNVKDKTVAKPYILVTRPRPSHLQHGDPYSGKTTSLYWDSPWWHVWDMNLFFIGSWDCFTIFVASWMNSRKTVNSQVVSTEIDSQHNLCYKSRWLLKLLIHPMDLGL